MSCTRGCLSSVASFIDVWKFGWGTAIIDSALSDKIAALKAAQVKICTGGTLIEIAWLQGKTVEFFDFAFNAGFDCVEVSNGATPMPLIEKRALISRARELGFEVMAETGSKDASIVMSPDEWRRETDADVAAGATWIIAEGRESGNVGLYDEHGEVRQSLLSVLQQSVNASRIIYETPRRDQQSFLLRQLGPEANLGNIAPEDIMSLESLRLGLRADTIGITSGTVVPDSECWADVRV